MFQTPKTTYVCITGGNCQPYRGIFEVKKPASSRSPNPKVKKYPTFSQKEGIFVAKWVSHSSCSASVAQSLGDLICCLFWRLSVLGLERCVLGGSTESFFDHRTELLVV